METIPQFYKDHLLKVYHVSEKEYEELLPYLSVKSFKKDEFLLFHGDICGHIFYVEQGLLRSYSIDESGKEHIIQFAPEGWFMGDRGNFLFKQPSEYFIQAIEDTRVVLLDEEFNDKASSVSASYRHYNAI
ncbi:Crp/Fnr family transcriptional regulator, partial [Pseudoxanthomonas sp. SGD-10]